MNDALQLTELKRLRRQDRNNGPSRDAAVPEGFCSDLFD